MQWLEVSISTTSAGIDILAAGLTAIGYDSFIIDDTEDFNYFLTENTKYWDYVDEDLAAKMSAISQIRLYIENNAQASEDLLTLKNELELLRQRTDLDLGTLDITVANLQNEDWENNWKQYYSPIPIGEKLLIVPEWITPDNPEGRVCVRLDPGMIFGTGAHASTQMCLAALEQCIVGDEEVIDLGSGSGILSIASLLLGAKNAIGIDIDPKAEDIARENAALNNLCAPAFIAATGNVLEDQDAVAKLNGCTHYDIVLANIVADVIIPLSAIVPSLLNKSGTFICSGILNTRLAEVKDAICSAGMYITAESTKNDWCCLTAKLKEA